MTSIALRCIALPFVLLGRTPRKQQLLLWCGRWAQHGRQLITPAFSWSLQEFTEAVARSYQSGHAVALPLLG